MAKINKVKIYNEWYDIEDRTLFNGRNDMVIKQNGLSIGSVPGNTTYGSGYVLGDKNGNAFGGISTICMGTGTGYDGLVYTNIYAAQRPNSTTTTEYSEYLRIGIHMDGSPRISFKTPQAWLNALGLTDTGWSTMPSSSAYTGNIRYRKFGRTVMVLLDDIHLTANRDSSGWTILTTIPEGSRPGKYAYVMFTNRAISNQRGILFADPNGELKISADNGLTLSSQNIIYTSLTYLT